MTSKKRMITALERKKPDRLPVTTHHVMPFFLDTYLDGRSVEEFFDFFNMDAIRWIMPVTPNEKKGEYYNPDFTESSSLQMKNIISDNWQISTEDIPHKEFKTTRYTITTPKGKLTMVLQGNIYTVWVTEYLVKEKRDIDLIEEYMTFPICDIEAVNREADLMGERGIVRACILPFDIYGQPGCWQDF